MIENPDLSELKEMIQSYIDDIDKGEIDGEDDDSDVYIYECVLKTFFGENYFDWHNNKIT